MGLRDDIQELAHQLAEESNDSYDLWTWLPSHMAAEKGHGDYGLNHRPSPAGVMREAACVMSALGRGNGIAEEFLSCPCGECDVAVTAEEYMAWLRRWQPGVKAAPCQYGRALANATMHVDGWVTGAHKVLDQGRPCVATPDGGADS